MNPIWGVVLGFILHVYIIESSMFYGVSVLHCINVWDFNLYENHYCDPAALTTICSFVYNITGLCFPLWFVVMNNIRI